MQKLILIDIDGTLIRGKFERSSEAFYEDIKMQAIKDIYGVEVNIDWRVIQGKTDQQIIIDALKEAGQTSDFIFAHLDKCMESIIEHFRLNLNDYYAEPINGITDLLLEFKKQNEILGLVTGNIETVARMKLNKAGILHYFELGGFGNENAVRSKLIENALNKAIIQRGFQRNENVYYFGDSPKDIQAAKEANVLSIGVATGVYNIDTLNMHNPDFILPGYTEVSVKRVLDFIY